MLCFKGRWWCGEQRECAKAAKCDRVFRARHHHEATRWWGGEDYPVDFHPEPECFEPVKKE